MTDSERAEMLLGYGMSFQASKFTVEQAYDFTMRDIAAIREDERNKVLQSLQSEKEADHSPDAGNMVALELVEDIRSGGFAFNANDPKDRGPNGDDYHFTLTDSEAAVLIESYGRRVPRAMLEEIERKACRNGDIGGCSCLSLNKIAIKYGVKIEEEGE